MEGFDRVVEIMLGFITKEKYPILYEIRLLIHKIKVAFTPGRMTKDEFPVLVPQRKKGRLRGLHLSAFTYGNIGDTVLPIVLRDIFSQTIGVRSWEGKHVHDFVSWDDIDSFNKKDFIVIGGGGLFLKDTAPNNNSGWQWNCEIGKLKHIRQPLIAFAIGYNRFRGQDDFEPIFNDHINAFIKQCDFVGLRNHGSIDAIRKYIKDEKDAQKIVFQPCMTTVISHVYPDLLDYTAKDDYIAFNCAFDRKELRGNDDEIMNSIARVAKSLSGVTKIKYFSHVSSDNDALVFFDKYHVPYELVSFSDAAQVVQYYSKARLVIGMRGHAQMIPFGCCTPILSIVSHDKMQWFLDDIAHPEWGVDVRSSDFESQLLKKASMVYDKYEAHINDIIKSQDKLWEITMSNMITINTIIKGKCRKLSRK